MRWPSVSQEFQASNFRKTTAASASILAFLRFWSLTARYPEAPKLPAGAAAADPPPHSADKILSQALLDTGCIPLLILAARGALATDTARRGIADNALVMIFHASLHNPEALTPAYTAGFDTLDFCNFLVDTAAGCPSLTSQVGATSSIVPV